MRGSSLRGAIIQFTALSCRFVVPALCRPGRRGCRRLATAGLPQRLRTTIPEWETLNLGPLGRASQARGRLTPVSARLWSAPASFERERTRRSHAVTQ